MLKSWRELSWNGYKSAGRKPVKVGEKGERKEGKGGRSGVEGESCSL